MRRAALAALVATGIIELVACATDSEGSPLDLGQADARGEDTSPLDAGSSDGGATIDLDAERPLVCGDAGFCETRLPLSRRGTPLSLRSVWAVASNDVWSVTAEGDVLHYDGTSWEIAYRGGHTLYAVWATTTSVWAGGEGGILLRRTGSEWTIVETGHVSSVSAIAGTSDSDVWFTSPEGSVDHFDGTTLTNHPLHVPGLRTTSVFGGMGRGIYAAGYVPGRVVDPYQPVRHRPYVFELTSAGPTMFNVDLPDHELFIPAAGAATDSADDDHRLFVVGYTETQDALKPRLATIGRHSRAIYEPPAAALDRHFGAPGDPLPALPLWAPKWNDIYVPYAFDPVYRWSGSGVTRVSLNMGMTFIPRPIFGAHGYGADMWIVGNGFALKGPGL